ncbi:hypothetical protein TTHERM_01015930 (macronuclear) [Tetrahymena thermophila SB210]|uniref:Uncharacterized protein n=1 Tax=Tetrahymena thermophila (strain SB210) TaxID=312017 RepID=Q22CU8_TETTS|nr:hypothetical protein TTHERM_01015930 [Tetrahymena thermophila SB210]EAR83090.2 hypothetical protein TTHERM_01015930 [Tetrahymena thermophila SB210]|eukprot:XP_001030753.2 hypothetical protein TTHERM_01015930 [Tetrahymena thermophila SB210]
MAQKEKQKWQDIEDDEDYSNSPQINQDTQMMTVEYKLQPTGEQVNVGGNKFQKKFAPKKPLLTAEEMIEQIKVDKYQNVFLHCFLVNGSAENFEEAFKEKVRYAQLTEAKNQDRDNSIDLKFDDKQEAIKFIQLSQTTAINGKTFRVKFGKFTKQGDGFKKGDYKDRPRYSQNERRDYKGGERVHRNDDREHHHRNNDKREPYHHNRENREHFQNRENREHHQNRENREHHQNRENREFKPYYKKDYHNEKKQEEKPIQKQEEQTVQNSEAQQQAPVEEFKPRGFINTKKNLNHSDKESAEQIRCVDTNAKVLEKQKRDEQERLARLEEEKKLQGENQEKVEQKEHHHSKDKHAHHHGHGKDGKGKREDRSKGKQQKSTGETQKSEKVVYEKKEQQPSQPQPQAVEAQEKTASNEEKSQAKKKLKLPENTKVEDEWNVVPGKVADKKKSDGKGKNGNNDSRRNNNNNQKPKVTYTRKDEQK